MISKTAYDVLYEGSCIATVTTLALGIISETAYNVLHEGASLR